VRSPAIDPPFSRMIPINYVSTCVPFSKSPMSTQKPAEAASIKELRDEHKQLVVEKERLEEHLWNLQHDIKGTDFRVSPKK